MEYNVTAKDNILGFPKLVFQRKYSHTDSQCMAAFVASMNAKSSEMGLDPQTIWMNPSGREDDGVSYSTAKSLAIMTAFASGYPELCEIWSKSSHVVKRKDKQDITVTSSVFTNNVLTNSYPILGGKTGSGFNLERTFEYNTLVAITEINGHLIAGAIMDATSASDRFNAMKQLFEATEATMNGTTPSPITYATKACSVYVPSCPRTYLADKFTVIYTQNENTATGTMSVAKVMTAMIVLDNLTDINKSIKIASADLIGGSGAFFL